MYEFVSPRSVTRETIHVPAGHRIGTCGLAIKLDSAFSVVICFLERFRLVKSLLQFAWLDLGRYCGLSVDHRLPSTVRGQLLGIFKFVILLRFQSLPTAIVSDGRSWDVESEILANGELERESSDFVMALSLLLFDFNHLRYIPPSTLSPGSNISFIAILPVTSACFRRPA